MRSNEMKEAELLRLYLLGRLSGEESDTLERRLLAESELFELAEAVEGDLLAACARGELSPVEREEVLRRLAASPSGQARLALARDLATLARQEERRPAAVLPFRRPANLDRPVFRAAALAASLTLVVGGLWLARHETANPGRRPAEEQRARLEATTKGAHPLQPLVYVLGVSTTRSLQEATGPLKITPGTEDVEIRLLLPRSGDFPSYRVVLSPQVGDRIERTLTARTEDDHPVVTLPVPASKLAPGAYRIKIWGGSSGQETEFLGESPFVVQSP